MLEIAETWIALCTQQKPDFTCFMIVVNMESPFEGRLVFTATRTAFVLTLQHPGIIFD